MSSKKNESDLFLVFKNVLTMIKTRGYNIDVPTDLSYDEYSILYNIGFDNYYINSLNTYIKNTFGTLSFLLKLTNIYEHSILKVLNSNNELINKLCIVFYLNVHSDISTDIFKRLSDTLDSFGCDTLDVIIISNLAFTSNTLKHISSSHLTHNIQLFLYSELCFNYSDSFYGPKYTIMSLEESDAFLAKNNILRSQLPVFCSDAPIVKYYDVKFNQIIKCVRKIVIPGSLLNEEIFYRIVSKKKIDIKKFTIKK